jgi:hypothetical protein
VSKLVLKVEAQVIASVLEFCEENSDLVTSQGYDRHVSVLRQIFANVSTANYYG